MERRDEGPEASARTVLQVAADATPGSPQLRVVETSHAEEGIDRRTIAALEEKSSGCGLTADELQRLSDLRTYVRERPLSRA